jgi:hypothetical protein
VLATRHRAYLADGEGGHLVEVDFVQDLQSARVAGDRAVLAGRERVELWDFAGVQHGAVSPGGVVRQDIAFAVVEGVGVGVAFYDRFLVLHRSGRGAVHLVQPAFKMLVAVGDRVVAAGRDLVVMASAADPSRVVTLSARKPIRHGLVRVQGDLAAIPAGDWLCIVDARGGFLLDRSVEGEIKVVTVEDERILVSHGESGATAFDRAGKVLEA